VHDPEPACLLIVDISGYTGYLVDVELDHAQDILADLVDTIVAAVRPTFRLAKLEGDAAFAYALTAKVDGSLLQDVVERTYVAFRRRLRDISRASRCECNACIRIPTLDLKAVVHHGTVVRQRVAGRDELVGRDVIVIHRLLKNSIGDATGITAYAAYSEACIAVMGIGDPAAQGLVEHRETIEMIGDVRLWIRDLDAVWAADQAGPSLAIPADQAWTVYGYSSPLPPAATWEFVTSPIRRPQWGGMSALKESSVNGRRGAGTVNHCVHGRDTIVEEVLEWRPFETLTTRSALPMPGAPRVVLTDVLTPREDGGTDVEVRVGPPKPRERSAFEQLMAEIGPLIEASSVSLQDVLQEEAARLEAERRASPEPEVPRSGRRHATEPLTVAGAAARPAAVDSGRTRSLER
jgi:hypothetical protein